MKETYRQIKKPINSTLTVVQDEEKRWGVIDSENNIIVPFGVYAWIDGFQNGLAKVIGHKDTSGSFVGIFDLKIGENEHPNYAQGIINEEGKEVLPLEYNVWKFYGKDFPTIKYYKGDKVHIVRFTDLNPGLMKNDDNEDNVYFDDDYGFDPTDYRGDSWDVMTDGMYGDMPEDFDGDFDFLGR